MLFTLSLKTVHLPVSCVGISCTETGVIPQYSLEEHRGPATDLQTGLRGVSLSMCAATYWSGATWSPPNSHIQINSIPGSPCQYAFEIAAKCQPQTHTGIQSPSWQYNS